MASRDRAVSLGLGLRERGPSGDSVLTPRTPEVSVRKATSGPFAAMPCSSQGGVRWAQQVNEPGSSIFAVMTPGKNALFYMVPRLFLERGLQWGGQLWLQPPRSVQKYRHLSTWYDITHLTAWGVTFLARPELECLELRSSSLGPGSRSSAGQGLSALPNVLEQQFLELSPTHRYRNREAGKLNDLEPESHSFPPPRLVRVRTGSCTLQAWVLWKSYVPGPHWVLVGAALRAS